MHPRFRTLVPLAALVLLVHAAAHAQQEPRRNKRVRAVAEGMTPAQVFEVLGQPSRVRREGDLAYLYFPRACAGCEDDYVVVRDCRVVDARLAGSGRYYVRRRGEPDAGAVPGHECAIPGEPPVAQMQPPPPRDAEPRQIEQQPVAPPPPPEPPPPPPAPRLSAQEWRERLRLDTPVERIVALPAASISSPTAFGVDFGQAYVSVGYQGRTRFTDQDDAAVTAGLGLGDRNRYAGLELTLSSYSTIRGGGPFETGGVGLKLHRAVGPWTGVAVGVENLASWGGSDAGRSAYAVGTHVFRLADPGDPFSALAATLGVGNGRFRSEDDVFADEETVNVFGALGLQVLEQVSLVGDWNGQDLFAAVSIAPLRHVPLVINLGAADLTETAGDGPRFIASVAYGLAVPLPFR
ncbi:MAG TPA: hypothetical protein VF746_21775 [Longimicrobium sp.]|jgi:hypothetical protein